MLTEALNDIALALAPLSETDCGNLLDGIHARRLLASFRGEPAVNREKLEALLKALSNIALDHPDIDEIDIKSFESNPGRRYLRG